MLLQHLPGGLLSVPFPLKCLDATSVDRVFRTAVGPPALLANTAVFEPPGPGVSNSSSLEVKGYPFTTSPSMDLKSREA